MKTFAKVMQFFGKSLLVISFIAMVACLLLSAYTDIFNCVLWGLASPDFLTLIVLILLVVATPGTLLYISIED